MARSMNWARQTLGFSPGREAPLKTLNSSARFSGHITNMARKKEQWQK